MSTFDLHLFSKGEGGHPEESYNSVNQQSHGGTTHMHAGSYREPLPSTVFYRRSVDHGSEARPKLADLLGNMQGIGVDNGEPQRGPEPPTAGDEARVAAPSQGYSFGMWEGVFVRCLLNILGVIMFLRLSWITGNAGIGITFAIILCSALVTSITTLSLSAICTNGEVAAGGLYFMISRSLGPAFGGSIGITFYMANSISVALYVVGFGEAMVLMLDAYFEGFSLAGDWDQTIYALIAMFALTGVALSGGAKLEILLQKVLVVVMGLSLVSFLVGAFLLDKDDNPEDGLTGFSGETLNENLSPNFEDGESWMTAFGVFFPAVTGIMAGANISGDLKDPIKAIPTGTLLSIGTSTVVYLTMALILGAVTLRATLIDFENVIAVVEISWVPELVYAGIFAATLSSALAQLIGAPRILQAIAKDNIFPCLSPFAVTYGAMGEPLRGYGLTLAIGFATTLAGDLNTISPLITNFFLLSYALVNYACCAATLSKSPGWRPGYKYWNPWVALVGAILCFAIMLTWWIAAFATILLCVLIYKYIEIIAKPSANWGSAGQAAIYLRARDNVYELTRVPSHVKNFRPQYLVLTPPGMHPEAISDDPLVHFTSMLGEGQGIMVVGHVLVGTFEQNVSVLQEAREVVSHNLAHASPPIKSFVDMVISNSYLEGIRMLLQLSGVGKLRPNTAMVNFPEGWEKVPGEAKDDTNDRDATDATKFVDVVRSSFGAGMAVCVLRRGEKIKDAVQAIAARQRRLGFPGLPSRAEPSAAEKKTLSQRAQPVFAPESPRSQAGRAPLNTTPKAPVRTPRKSLPLIREGSGAAAYRVSEAEVDADENPESPRKQAVQMSSRGRDSPSPVIFEAVEVDWHHSKTAAGTDVRTLAAAARKIGDAHAADEAPTVDVWWLVDDGGLTMLIPFLLRQHAAWRGARLRVLSLSSKGKLTKEQSRMTRLLAKFRIEADVVVVDRKAINPSAPTIDRFEKLSGSRLGSDAQARYFLTLSEILREESSRAALVIVSLPIPRYAMEDRRWLAYLELLSAIEPPMLLARGNQESVLTFYS